MAIEISHSLIFLCLSVILSTVFFFRNKIGYGQTKKNLPPGEMGLPWIGETMGFFKAQRKNRLFQEFIQPRMTKYGKIFKTRLMGSPTIIVNGAEANKFVLSNEFKLVKSSWPTGTVELLGKNSILGKQGDQYRFIRGLMSTTLGNSGLEVLAPRTCKSIEFHLEKHWNQETGDRVISLYNSSKILTFDMVFDCLLGIKVEPGTLGIFETIMNGAFSPPFKFPGSKFGKAKKARKEVEKMLVKVVREKKKEIEEGKEKKEDRLLLGELVGGLTRGEMTEEEVVDNVVLLVFAAHDTSSYVISIIFKLLAENPECYALLLQEHVEIRKQKARGESITFEDSKKMKYTWQVVRESMRLFPPVFGSFREAITDIEYQGFTIPKGWKILWTTYGTHFNEEHFKDPSRFDPTRFEGEVPPYVYLPFGGGPRLCAGYQLAKLNILIFIHYVVTRYDWSLIYPDEPIVMDAFPYPYHGLPIRVSLKTKP